jgi:hypothetical protein
MSPGPMSCITLDFSAYPVVDACIVERKGFDLSTTFGSRPLRFRNMPNGGIVGPGHSPIASGLEVQALCLAHAHRPAKTGRRDGTNRHRFFTPNVIPSKGYSGSGKADAQTGRRPSGLERRSSVLNTSESGYHRPAVERPNGPADVVNAEQRSCPVRALSGHHVRGFLMTVSTPRGRLVGPLCGRMPYKRRTAASRLGAPDGGDPTRTSRDRFDTMPRKLRYKDAGS